MAKRKQKRKNSDRRERQRETKSNKRRKKEKKNSTKKKKKQKQHRPPKATLQPEPATTTEQQVETKTKTAPKTLEFQAEEVVFAPNKKEYEGLCAAQIAFLERKAQYAFGGPHMPPSSICVVCDGAGKHLCNRCEGTGFNKGSGAEILGLDTSEDSVIISRNGRVDVNFYLAEGGICVSCRGIGECGCHLCEGTGFAGGITSKFVGD